MAAQAVPLDPTQHSMESRDFEAGLRRKIVGQGEAVQAVVDLYQVFRAGLNSPGRPVGNLLFLGPTPHRQGGGVPSAAVGATRTDYGNRVGHGTAEGAGDGQRSIPVSRDARRARISAPRRDRLEVRRAPPEARDRAPHRVPAGEPAGNRAGMLGRRDFDRLGPSKAAARICKVSLRIRSSPKRLVDSGDHSEADRQAFQRASDRLPFPHGGDALAIKVVARGSVGNSACLGRGQGTTEKHNVLQRFSLLREFGSF